ncbi:bifunctional indole-3-glycerol phosphate synthase/phosphoribosylanthranilate isomerase [Idiomarina sp. WRN-38]|uniref:bifunctional indole-3-glycerol-phosphate synthase TrpC/phosphoribosylanthranilate isomerase TrpF n=1 Tax=Idiomarina sp. OXR-189 TaxID=3100175 RepID=UPI0007339252|nr:bifunctional indole-3-glycerol-phosphate synthase TrpC/phosphoribosylanthranilate isomerase TrpF [Idiomarina sp. OXR-189]KTG23279.1 bifunctional indole-3-glycerol phosphate synthase/phosphoribosylanthranilate isomerase [Idiomarina sp. H105]OAE90672.1 bifunctional indole-3-glycerol phosphate synthase/phosphoribosylanthranilate isomerase [Idiomarina sp. WRN-38]WPZ00573.1 bifunctional indole-3-glycerol-phosphate synthase TrpC/phosphoribosylanthranilate isomerase TrpF [Idiomarina sp. OXR-189]
MSNTISLQKNVLKTIVERKVEQNKIHSELMPVSEIKPQLSRSDRSLYEALNGEQAGFILECKKASPSKGLIRADFDAPELAKSYAPYAAAISVLTEPEFFQGRLDYLTAVRQQVTQPVLCKDFFIDEEQVYRARYFGADAILLMLSVLNDEQYTALRNIADSLSMDVLTEVANEEEMQRAVKLDARIIGINHRDLTDLSIDPNRSAELTPLAPQGALLVAESGFSTHADIRRVAPYVNGFLVGSALSAKPNVDLACRELLFGQNKVCGLTRAEDAINARSQGAAYGGLIFVEHSARCINIEQAQQITTEVNGLNYVGVFADTALQKVVEAVSEVGLSVVQLHGHEDIDYIVQLRQQLREQGLSAVKIWKAMAIETPAQLPDLPVDAFVLDNRKGGSGQVFDWSLLENLTPRQRQRCLLAGGIGPESIDQAITLGFAGVDMNSRVEWTPGIKNSQKVSQTFMKIRQYGRFSEQQVSKRIQQEAV